MIFILKVIQLGISLQFFAISAIAYVCPQSVKEYADIRFRGFHQFAFANSQISTYVPSGLVRKIPLSKYKIISVIIAFGGVAILMEKRTLILAYAYFTMIIGGVLHMPYTTTIDLRKYAISQIRRLLYVFVVFCTMITLASNTQEKQLDTSCL